MRPTAGVGPVGDDEQGGGAHPGGGVAPVNGVDAQEVEEPEGDAHAHGHLHEAGEHGQEGAADPLEGVAEDEDEPQRHEEGGGG